MCMKRECVIITDTTGYSELSRRRQVITDCPAARAVGDFGAKFSVEVHSKVSFSGVFLFSCPSLASP